MYSLYFSLIYEDFSVLYFFNWFYLVGVNVVKLCPWALHVFHSLMLTVHILKIPIPIPFKFPAAQIQYIFGWLEIVENLGRKIRCEMVIIFQMAFS